MKDAIIYFNIKNRQLFGSNLCIAESFLSFEDIPDFSVTKKLIKQTHLTLTRLLNDDIECLQKLQARSLTGGDKTAKEFLVKVRSTILPSSPQQLKAHVTKLQ